MGFYLSFYLVIGGNLILFDLGIGGELEPLLRLQMVLLFTEYPAPFLWISLRSLFSVSQ